MRRVDDSHPDPDADAAVSVIDATLAGEAVDPQYAELAELALILAGQRPQPTAEFTAALDQRVGRRFAGPPRSGSAKRRSSRRRRWLYAPGAMAGLAAAVAVVIVLSSGNAPRPLATAIGGTASSAISSISGTSSSASAATPTPKAPRAALPAAGRNAPFGANSAAEGNHALSSASSSSAGSAAAGGVPGSATVQGSAGSAATPPTSGRQVVQSAQLSLTTRPGQVEDVAQQVFDVVGNEHGVVNNSTVTAGGGSDSYAQFQLSVPSSNLQSTLSALSALHGARVASRSDSSQDITGQVGGAGQRLADARALRTSLLRQLAAATTTTAVDSLKAQIRDAEASIASDLSTLRGLHRKVDYTQIAVTVNAAMAPGHPVSTGSSFTLGRAVHTAGRVLVVAAGVALIALAVLVPLSLLGGMILWLALATRRRRREQALDLV